MFIWFMAGLVVGWIIEWIIDWNYWRRAVLVVPNATDETLRQELEAARQQLAYYEERLGKEAFLTTRQELAANIPIDAPTNTPTSTWELVPETKQEIVSALVVNATGTQRKSKK